MHGVLVSVYMCKFRFYSIQPEQHYYNCSGNSRTIKRGIVGFLPKTSCTCVWWGDGGRLGYA